MNHWNTQSYAQHMALEGFYEGVLGPIDDLVEDYQAAFGLIGKKLEGTRKAKTRIRRSLPAFRMMSGGSMLIGPRSQEGSLPWRTS